MVCCLSFLTLALLVVAEGWQGGGIEQQQQQQAKVLLGRVVEAERVLMSSQGAVFNTSLGGRWC